MDKIKGGYIVLARQIMESPSWHALNEAGKVVMITLLMLANHKDKKWYNPLTKQEILIKRGQCVVGRKSLALKSRVGERSVRTALTTLKSTSFLTIETTNKYSIVNICKYEFYQNHKNYIDQVNDHQNDQKPTSKRPASDQQATTNNKLNTLKNEKNEKNIIPPEIEQVISYCKERNNNVDPETWYNHYSAKGWYIGKSKMKDWQAAVRTWEKNNVKSKEPYGDV